MIVVDEYVALRVVLAEWPAELPDDDLALPATRHWRLIQALTPPGRGGSRRSFRRCPSPTERSSANPIRPSFRCWTRGPSSMKWRVIAGRYGGTGFLIAETLAAGLSMGGRLWFGLAANVGRVVSRAAPELGIAVHVAAEG